MMNKNFGQVHFVNVGNGDAILIEISDTGAQGGRFVMVIDGGSNRDAEYADTSSGRIRMCDYMLQKEIDHIDLMVCTHIHEDHNCGLFLLAEKWPPHVLWQSYPLEMIEKMKPIEFEGRTESERLFISALNDFRKMCGFVTANGGTVVELRPELMRLAEHVYVQALGPEREAVQRERVWFYELFQKGNRDVLPLMDHAMNRTSLLLKLSIAGCSFLLTGDTEKNAYPCFRSEGKDNKDASLRYGQLSVMDSSVLVSDVFKLGHHGQAGSIDRDVLHAVDPKYAVICVSSDRRYGSGAPEILALLAEEGIPTFYSDCLHMLPYTDGVKPHRAVVFRISEGGKLDVGYEL